LRIATQKAVKAYVDDKVVSKDEASEISYDDSGNTKVVGADVQAALDAADTEIAANATAIGDGATDLTNHEADTSTHGVGEIVGTTEAQEVSNKSIQDPSRLDVKKDTEANLETYALTASDGQLCFATDSLKMFQVISNELQPVGGGGATSFEIEQAAHGLAVGEGVYHNGTTWVKGQADDADTLAYFTVVEVSDANTFIAADFGRIEVPSHGYTVGEYYFLSNTVAGEATSTEPSQGFSNPLFYVEDANILQVKVYRPSVLSDSISLDELNDVSAGSPTDGQVLAWDNGNSRWEAKDAVSAASDVTYDNSTSGLSATDAQAAIDEVEARVDTAEANISSNDTDIATNAADIVTVDNKLTNSAKGDLLTHNGSANVSLPVGLDGQFLVADSDEASGIKYSDSIAGKMNPVTDWESYTPTISNFGTTSLESFNYRRVGDTLEIKGFFTSGTTVTAIASVSLPTGLNYDISKHDSNASSDNAIIGTWSRTALDTNSGGLVFANTSNTDRVEFSSSKVYGSASTTAMNSTNGDNILGNSEGMYFYASLPIQGWTSGLDAAVQNIGLYSNEKILTSDITSTGDVAGLKFDDLTVGKRYRLGGVIHHSLASSQALYANIENGSTIVGTFDNDDNGLASGRTYSLAVNLTFVATDTELDFNITGISGTLKGNSTKEETFLQLIEEPLTAVIAGTFENINSSDLVVVEAAGSAGQTITAATEGIDFTTVSDPYGAWIQEGAHGPDTFVAPKNGTYEFSGMVNTSTAQSGIYIRAYIDTGSGYTSNKYLTISGATEQRQDFSQKLKLNAGDKVQLRMGDTSGLATDTTLHHLTITQSADYEAIVKNLNDNNNFVSQTKTLSADTSSTGAISDLTFNNLEIGKKYNFKFHHSVRWTSTGVCVNALNFEYGDGTDISSCNVGGQHNSGNVVRNIGIDVNFTATQTTVQMNLTNATSSTLEGNGDLKETYATLTELPDTTILNSNKFD